MERFSTLLLLATSALFSAFESTNSSAATITWHLTDFMSSARESQTATLLGNGQVLVVGGNGRAGEDPEYAELYDPVAGEWSKTTSLGYAIPLGHTATLLPDGRVLVVGGFSALSKVSLYNPVAQTWTAAANLIQGRSGHTATLLADGRVLVAAGYGGQGALSTAEIYDPATGQWRLTKRMNQARINSEAVLLPDGRVLVTGGADSNSVVLSSAELYDPVTGSWNVTGSMTTERISFTLSLLTNGKALAVGGYNDCQPCNYLKSTELYDPTSGTWSPSGDLNRGRSGHAAAELSNGRVVVSGGFIPNTTATVEVYDPNHQTWTSLAPMRAVREAHTMTTLQDDKLLVAGGDAGDSNQIKSAELGAIVR